MRLGIISGPDQASFQNAARRGLAFLEFCINVGTDPRVPLKYLAALKTWIRDTGVAVQSIGRWGPDRIDAQGKPVPQEMADCRFLIDACAELGCPNFVCGCNRVKDMPLLDNLNAAVAMLGGLVEYAGSRGVKVALYNCRWNNFLVDPDGWRVLLPQLPALGIKFDPSHTRYAGGDYLREMRDWGERFHHVHIKGSLVIDGQRFDDPPAGMDQTDWGSFMAILYAKGYQGGLSLEPHSANWKGELGEKGIDFTIAYMRRFLL